MIRRIRIRSAITAGTSKAVRITAGASLAVGLMAGVSVAGATSASAADSNFACTGSYPEICLGVSSSGEEAQANLDYGLEYMYWLSVPGGGQAQSTLYYASSAGWGQTASFPSWGPGYYCAWVDYWYPGSEYSSSAPACVYNP